MNIYQINKLTKNNILFYKTENKIEILYLLLNEGKLDDAIIIYNLYNWKYLKTTHKGFLKYLVNHKKKCKISLQTFKKICNKGDKELFFLGKRLINKYNSKYIIYNCLLSNNYNFIYFIFKYHNLRKISRNIFILCIKQKLNVEIIEFLFKYIDIDIYFVKDILYYIAKHSKYNKIIKYLFSLYPSIILKNEFNSFFYIALSYNNIQLCYYLLDLRPNIIEYINSYYLVNIFMNSSYDSIYLVYLLKNDIFNIVDHNYIFLDLICNPYFVCEKILSFYLTHFKDRLEDKIYYKCFETLCYHGRGNILKIILPYININLIDIQHYFLHGCNHNYQEIVELFIEYMDESIINNSFIIVCKNGYLNLAKLLYQENSNILYEAMYNISYNDINYNYEKIELIKWLYVKNDMIYPRELIYYLCKYGTILWIIDDITFFIDQKCINLLCLNGHFEVFYYIYKSKLFKKNYIYEAFYNACENEKGFFIAKWIYYYHYLPRKVILKSFYNSKNLSTIKWLYHNEFIHLRENNNAYFKEQCISNNLPVIEWLCSLYDNYHYCLMNDTIYYYIDLYKIKKKMNIEEECSVCYEKSNCKTICNHYFCDICIEQWYNKQKNCPICRNLINEIFIQH